MKVILPHYKLVLYPRMVSGPNHKISILLLNEGCVFVDNLLFAFFFFDLSCSLLLEFLTSSFLSMETYILRVKYF